MSEQLVKGGKLIHYVMFWLKPDLSVEEIDGFTGFFEQLKTINSVQSFIYGKSAVTEKRDVVDNSFSYAMFAEFATLQDHEDYQVDPVHLKAIETYSKYWEKVVVHDTQLITA
jgi:hypothetical protein